MKTLLVLILLLAIAGGGYWYFTDTQHKQEVQRREEQAAKQAQDLKDSVKERLKDWHVNTSDIRQELDRTGQVVRKKAQQVGSALADAAADARITTAIKAKLVKDPNLSALEISVNTTGGVVTLSGRVASAEEVKDAMNLALETDGVNEVISTLQIRAAK